jgi:hypothetical protein
MTYKIPKSKGWKKVGVVGVDSGTIHIGDPAYVEDFDYQKDVVKGMENKKTQQLNFKLGHKGRGVITEAGFGDGVYPVYAKISDEGEFGKRVKEIKVQFIED